MAKPRKVTREELYTLIWTDPVTKVAQRIGLSDVRLAKICKKMLVPKPPPGYWARRQHGKPVQQTPLPEPAQGTVLSWVFSSLTVQRTAKELPVETKAKMDQERLPERKVVVPEQLDQPHALVARTRSVLAKIKTDEYPAVSSREEDCLALRVSHETLPRALCVLDALLKALEARGAIINGRGSYHPFATHVRMDNETVSFHMTERISRSDHVATEAEIKGLEKRGWPQPPKWDYRPTGNLVLAIDAWGVPVKKTFSDNKSSKLEEKLNDAIASVVAVAAHRKQERIKREIEERERAERQARYEELQRQRKIEQARRSLLEELASDSTKSNEIRAFLLQVARKASECGADAKEELVGWLKWAQAHADRLDPLAAGVDHILKKHAEAEPEEPEESAYLTSHYWPR